MATRITQEAVDNFCGLTGCKVSRRGYRKKATWQVWDSRGRKLFFCKQSSSMRRFMELYEHSQNNVSLLNFWGTQTGTWSSAPRYSGKLVQNLQQQIYSKGPDLPAIWFPRGWEICSANPISYAARRPLHGDAGRHGVSIVRAFVMDAVGSGDAEVFGSPDQYGAYGTYVPRGDPESAPQETEARVVRLRGDYIAR